MWSRTDNSCTSTAKNWSCGRQRWMGVANFFHALLVLRRGYESEKTLSNLNSTTMSRITFHRCCKLSKFLACYVQEPQYLLVYKVLLVWTHLP